MNNKIQYYDVLRYKAEAHSLSRQRHCAFYKLTRG